MKRTLLLLIFGIGVGMMGWGQTNSYLGLDGGFEGTATIDNTATGGIIPVASKWSKANANATIANETGIVRSGINSLKVSSSTTSTCRVWSPLVTISASTTKWVVQYYRRASSTTACVTNQSMIYRGAIESTSGSYTTVTIANTWEKVTYSPTSTASVTAAAAGVFVKMATSAGDTYYDDFCLYESSTGVDVTVPDPPTLSVVGTPTTSSLNVNWTAPASTDGGGYLVVRGTSDPATAPLVNGIYAVNSTVATGMTVVYRGTGTSFTDNGLNSNTTYYYRIYTYDKAYNYSSALTGNGTTSSSVATPPTLTAAVNATVDNPFDVTFTDDPTWRAAITAITVGGTTLTAGSFVSSGKITFTPSSSAPAALLQTSGTKSIAVIADGYSNATVSQEIGAGADNNLSITTQPAAPAINGSVLATQPIVAIRDQYGNATTSTAGVVASVGAGTWTIGGTTTKNGDAGTATFTDLTATSAAAVTGATISFTSGSLTAATSNGFDIPAPLPQIDWANLQWPASGTIDLGADFTVYAQVWEPGVTDAAGQGAGITAWIGYSTSNTDPSTWTNWVEATYNTDAGNNDEYKANIGAVITPAGTYYYASRFQLGAAAYVYGGFNGGFWNGTSNVSGTLTINPPPQIDWVNLQSPANGTITVGGTFDVYSQVYEPGLTPGAGQGAGISAWIGYSSTDDNPATGIGWTWVSADYNINVTGNNDEYMKEIGSGLSTGTYYYASRFKYGLADYMYGGYSSGGGGFWDGTTNVSGVLTINATEPSNHVTNFTAAANSSSTITVSWTDAVAEGYLIKGSTVGYGSIVAPVDGTAEADGGLVKNIASGVKTYQFTGLTASTPYYFKIFPYNGSAAAINYKTDGTVPEATATTPSMPVIVINEVDSDTPGSDLLEFVELFDGGVGNSDLTGFVVVFYNGSNDLSYAAYDLDGHSTDANGYFVLGNSAVSNVDLVFVNNTLQNGQDAVALYTGDAISFPLNTAVTTSNLLDALVYDTDEADDPGLLVLLNSSQPQINENGRLLSAEHSMQRLPNGSGGQRNTTSYDLALPTPGAMNDFLTYTWTGGTNTSWSTNTNWSGSAVPDAGTHVVIPNVSNKPILSGTGNCRNLSIDLSSSLVIGIAGSLTVTGALTNNVVGYGGLVIESNASGTGSLICYNSVNATVQRYLTQNYYHYISSPVAAQNISPEFINTDPLTPPSTQPDIDFYRWDEINNTWDNIKQTTTTWDASFTTFETGRGYVYANTSGDVTKNFTGALNVTTQTIKLTVTPDKGNGWNIVGNPFASTMAVNSGAQVTDNLIDANSSLYETGYAALYFWKEQTGYSGSARSAEYEVINNLSPALHLNPGQAFMIKAKTHNSDFVFNANMRKHGTSPFYKSTNSDDYNRFTLVVTGPEGDFNETLLGFAPGATTGLDEGFDAIKRKGNANIALYSKLVNGGAGDFAIQALPQSGANEVVAISLDANKTGTYIFKAGAADNMENFTVKLEDRLTGIFTTLEGNAQYSFAVLTAGKIENRFFLHFKSSVGIEDPATTEKTIYSWGNTIYFETSGNATLDIFNLTGQKIESRQINTGGSQSLSLHAPTGWYIVKLVSADGVKSEKIFIN